MSYICLCLKVKCYLNVNSPLQHPGMFYNVRHYIDEKYGKCHVTVECKIAIHCNLSFLVNRLIGMLESLICLLMLGSLSQSFQISRRAPQSTKYDLFIFQ